MKTAHTIALFLLLLGTHSACAQSSLDSLISDEIERLLVIWEEFDDPDNLQPDQSYYSETAGFLTTPFDLDRTTREEFLISINQAKADLLHNDWGLDANANYLENFGGGADEDNLIYNRRFQTGLNWSILGSGFFGNRLDEEVLLNDNAILQQQSEATLREMDHTEKWHSIIYLFNQQKVEVLNERLELVERRLEIANKLHYLRHLSKEDLLDIQSKEAEIRSMFNIYESYNEQLEFQIDTSVIPSYEFPLVDINYENAFRAMNTGESDSIIQLRLANLDLEHSVLHDISLKTNVRYNWYDLTSPTNPSRSFMSAGITVSVPIPLNLKANQAIYDAEREYILSGVDEELNETQKELLNYFYEFRYKLKQYTSFYEKKFQFLEQLRQERVRYKLNPINFNPLTALSILDDIKSIEIELIDLQQNMYLKILNIYSALPDLTAEELMVPFELPNYFEIDDQIERSVYVWSEGVTAYSADFVAEYMRFNEIEKMVITANTSPEVINGTKAIAEQLEETETGLEIMVGRNSLVNEDAATFLTELWTSFSDMTATGIHLDVEPHTFDDWQERKEEYLSNYLVMLDDARTFCDNNELELSVSIPLHYPENYVSSIIEVCDNVYFMAYENIDVDYIERKLEPSVTQDSSKVVIALRTDDFENRYWMEEHVLQLYELTGVNRFAIHDLSSMVQFDEAIVTDQE